MSPPATDSTGHPPRQAGLEKGHRGSPSGSAPVPPASHWGLPLSDQGGAGWRPGQGRGGPAQHPGGSGTTAAPPPHRGGNSRTEEIAAGARPESSRPTRAAQGCRQIRAAPQDHRPPRPPTQGEKQEGNEEAGDHTQLKGQENSRKNKATNLFHLTDGESRKEIMKILKTVRRAIDGADSCKQN